MDTDGLKVQINVVAEAREATRLAISVRESSYQKWVEANEGLLNNESLAKLGRDTAEAKLREMTLQAYAETGNKTPEIGLGIRIMTRLAYENPDAMFWALEHKLALKLDTSAFEKMVKANPLSFNFVTISEEPQATIATDLQEIK